MATLLFSTVIPVSSALWNCRLLQSTPVWPCAADREERFIIPSVGSKEWTGPRGMLHLVTIYAATQKQRKLGVPSLNCNIQWLFLSSYLCMLKEPIGNCSMGKENHSMESELGTYFFYTCALPHPIFPFTRGHQTWHNFRMFRRVQKIVWEQRDLGTLN